MKLFVQPYVKVMLYLGGPMLLSSAVLWFVYLWNLVYLGILAIFSVVIGYIPVCGCALLLVCGVGFSFCGTLCWAECCGRSRVDVLLVFPFLGMLCWVECCVGSRVDVGCLPVSCWLFLACCIVVCVVCVWWLHGLAWC